MVKHNTDVSTHETTICVYPDPIAQLSVNFVASVCAPLQIDTLGISAIDWPQANDSITWQVFNSSGVVVADTTGLTIPSWVILDDDDHVCLFITAHNSCGTNVDSIQINTIDDPIADFTISDTAGCHTLTVHVDTTGLSTDGEYVWELIDQNGVIRHTINTLSAADTNLNLTNYSNTNDSTYTIKLTIGDPATGCFHSYTSDTITVYHIPDAEINISTNAICAPDTITATDISISGNNLNYIWTVSPDSGTSILDSTLASTDILFPDNQSGTSNMYNIYLSVTDQITGCQNTDSIPVELWTRPISEFSITDFTCGPDTLQIVNNSQFANANPPLDFSWDIINPNSGWNIVGQYDSIPNFEFEENIGPDSILYILQLTTQTDNGCTDINLDTLTIYPTPIIDFSPTDTANCGPWTITFDNLSNAQNNEDTASMSFQWLVDGQIVANTSTLTHTFDTIVGDTICYNVKLIGQTQHGCIDSSETTICVYPDPIAQLSVNFVASVCAPLQIDTLGISAIDWPQANDSITWQVFNSSGVVVADTTGLTIPSWVILDDDDHVWVVITAHNSCGTNVDSIQINTIDDPIADFTISDTAGCHILTVHVDTTGISTDGEYVWELIDQNGVIRHTINTLSASDTSFSLTNYSNTNDSTYTIKLTVGDPATGCFHSYTSDTITVYHIPDAEINISTNAICAPDTITATDISISGNNLNYIWTVSPDSGTSILDSTLASTDILFPDNQSGTSNMYNIYLSVTDQITGCQNTDSIPVELWTRPISEFSITDFTCGPDTLQIVNNSQFANANPPLDFSWDIINPNSGWNIVGQYDSIPNFEFEENIGPDSILYILQLTTQTDNGCTDISLDTLTIYPTPIIDFSPIDTANCGPWTITFDNLSNAQNNEDTASMSFQWLVDGQVVANTSTLTHTFDTIVGDTICYNVKLIGQTQHGCIDSSETTICVYPDPIAQLSVNFVASVCAPLQIDTLGISAIDWPQANDSITWQVFNSSGVVVADTTGLTIPSWVILDDDDHVWVVITAHNSCGTNVDSIQINTIDDPIADFTISDTAGCHILTVHVDTTGLSTDGEYVWELIDQNGVIRHTINTLSAADTSFNLTNYSNTNDSTYTIKLTVGDPATGCFHSYTSDTITVYHIPDAEINISTNAICAPDTITATDISISGNNLNYIWTVSPDSGTSILDSTLASTDILFPDNQSGTSNMYNIYLSVTDQITGCQNTDSIPVELWTRPISEFSITDFTCGPDTLQIVNNSQFANANPPLDFSWDIINPNSGWNIVGQYDSIPNFEFEENIGPDSILYILQLTTQTDNGCTDISLDTLTIYPTPIIDFSPIDTANCGPWTITFDNLSNAQNNEDTASMSFQWLVDGQVVANTSTLTHTFDTIVGDTICYNVKLIGQTQHGCIDSSETTICVYPDPIAQLSVNFVAAVCAPTQIDTLGISAIDWPQANDSVTWQVFNSSGVVVADTTGLTIPSWVILDDDDHVWVVITAHNSCGTNVDSIQINTIDDPIADFTISDTAGCHILTVHVDTTGLSTDGEYVWELIDQNGVIRHTINTLSAADTSFNLTNYSNTNDSTYTIKLTVGDPATGCFHSYTSDTITVYHIPDAEINISTNAICAPDTITATDISISGNNLNYIWTVSPDSGTSILDSTLASTDILFPDNQSGTSNMYNIYLSVTDQITGCQNTDSIPVELWTRPISEFSITDFTCGPDTLQIVNNSQFANANPPLDFSWDIINPNSGWNIVGQYDSIPNFEFEENIGPDSILYILQLTTQTDNGCTDISLDTLTIYPTPIIDFSPIDTANCGPWTITFDNLSNAQNNEDTASMSFQWLVDGQVVANTSTLTHTFDTIVGDTICYNVKLIGQTQHGCIDSSETTICVYPDPIAQLSLDSIESFCAPIQIDTLGISAIDWPQANDSITWQVFNSSGVVVADTTGLTIPSWVILDDDDHVWVVITAHNSCGTNVDSIQINTIDDPIADFTISDTAGCHILTVHVDTTGLSTDGEYVWELIDQNGVIRHTINTLSAADTSFNLTNYSNTNDSTYTIKLTVGDPATGCFHSYTSDTITVYPLPLPVISMQNTCDSDSVLISDNSYSPYSQINSWQWDFGDTIASNDTSSSQGPHIYTYSTYGIWDVSLIITDQNECQNSISSAITIWPNPQAAFNYDYSCYPDSLCTNSIIYFSDTASTLDPLGGQLDSSFWIIDNIIHPVLYNNSVYNFDTSWIQAGTHTINHIVMSDNGCVDTSSEQIINVVDIPISSFQSIDTICITDPPFYVDTIFGNASSGYILNYIWEILDTTGSVIWSDTLNNDSIATFPLISDISSMLLGQQTQANPIGYLDYYIQLTVNNCCGSHTTIDTFTVRPSPRVEFQPYQSGVSLSCTDSNTYLIAGFPVQLILNNYIDMVNTDYVIIDWGDGTPTDSLYPYWYSFGNPLNLANQWGSPLQNNGISHTYLSTSYSGFEICIYGYNECDVDTFCCNLPVIPNNVISEVIPIDWDGCIGSEFKFRDVSTTSFPGTITKWWFEYDSLNPGQAPDTVVNPFTPPEDTISYTYNTPGAYLVKHEIDANINLPGLPPFSDTSVISTIYVYPNPVANFSANLTVCMGDTSFFESTSFVPSIANVPQDYPNPNTLTWSVDGSVVQVGGVEFDTLFTAAGTYEVKLEVWSLNNNCYDTIVKYINVFEGPNADFNVDSIVCLDIGNATIFDGDISSQGSSAIINWLWDFEFNPFPGAQTYSSNVSGFATHEYTSIFTYTALLVVTDANGCQDSAFKQIIVTQGADAIFTADTVCFGDETTLDATINGNGTINDRWYWDCDQNGIINSNDSLLTYQFTYPGIHFVELTVENDIGDITCSATSVQQILVWDLPNPSIIEDTTCFGDTTRVINTSSVPTPYGNSIGQYIWDFGDPSTGVNNIQSSFTNEDGIHVYSDTGTYNVILVAIDNSSGQCKDTAYGNITIVPSPIAEYTVNPDCDGQAIYYTNTSPNLSLIDSVRWTLNQAGTFVNSSNSGSQNIAVIFASPGQKFTQLVVRDIYGCFSSPFIQPVDVYTNPKIQTLTSDTICDDNSTTFEFNTFLGSNPNITYSWDYGDLNTSNNPNSTHQHEYVNCGNYIVSLIIEDGNTCNDDTTITAIVRCNPVADFTLDNECLGDSVKFINQTNLVSGTIGSWIWNFGDNPPQGSILENPTYLYDSVATYTVTLNVIDDQLTSGLYGCSDSHQETVEIYALPEPSFETNIACEGDITVFTNTSTITNSPPNPTYHWNLNNFNGQWIGVTDSNSINPNYSFVGCDDNYPVTLTVTDYLGCSDSITNYVQVYCNPIASYLLGDIKCQRDSLFIMNDSFDDNGAPIYLWNWNFGVTASPQTYSYNNWSGTPPHPDTISTIFNNTSGYFTLQLDVVDTNGCYDDTIALVFIYDQPYVEFTWNNACAGEDVDFINLSTASDTGLWYWNWSFTHDTSTNYAIDWSPTFNYPTVIDTIGALVSAQLIVVDSAYCRDTFQTPDISVPDIEIHPLPIVDFVVPPICEFDYLIASDYNNSYISPFSVFDDNLSLANPNDTAWIINNNPIYSSTSLPEWNFLAQGPPLGPWSPGLYNIRLTRKTDFGCIASKSDTFRIYPYPRIDFVSETFNPVNQCGENVSYSFEAVHYDVNNWQYIIEDPFGGDTVNDPIINYDPPYIFKYPGIYNLKIHLENKQCQSDSTYEIHIFPNPKANFVADLYSGCEPTEINFIDQSSIPYDLLYDTGSSFIESYSLDFGDGTSYGTLDTPFTPPSHSYVTQNGEITNYGPNLTVVTNYGCVDQFTISDSITIYPTPVADILFPPEEIDFGLYLFDGTNSIASEFNPSTYATPENFWFTWIPGEGDTIGPRGPQFDENTDLFEYQYQSNSLNQGGREFIACLILEEKLYGCVDTTCISHDVNYFKGLYVPNALTPDENGGEASIFLPKGRSLREYKMQIFDKWGNLIFETNQLNEFGAPQIGWDGTMNGIPVQQGTYIWKIQGTFSDKTKWQGVDNKKSGPIYLIR